MTDILKTLLEITAYSAVLYAVILIFQKLFRKHISAALNYTMWALLVLRLLVPVTADSGLRLFVIPDETQQIADTVNSDSNTLKQTDYSLPSQQISDSASSQTQTSGKTGSPAGDYNSAQTKPQSIDWQTALVLLWGAGALGSFGYVTILWRRLQKRIKRCDSGAPEYVLKLAQACKRDMGIKMGPKISIQPWLKSPALSASIKPKLLLPEHMLKTEGLERIEFGIRHEFRHYMRKDHLANLLLLALRCVYWFNPVVYLAFRRIQADMETACDAGVTSRLNETGRARYIRTMIDLSGSGNMQYMLGMGMCKGRKAMEKRVRGIFMKKKTPPLFRTAAALLAGLMLIVCFTTACQPTPEMEVIVGRQEDILDVVTPTAFQKIETPEHVSETYDDFPKLKLSMDADVVVPEASAYPVTEVTKRSFSDDDILSFIKLLSGKNDELYTELPLTKDEWNQKFIEAKSNKDSGKVTPEWLDYLQKQAEGAQTDFEYISDISGLPDTDGGSPIYVKNADTVSEYVFKRGENYFNYTRYMYTQVCPAHDYEDGDFDANWGTKEQFEWQKPGEPEISQQDAYNKALECMDTMGADLSLFSAEPCSVITDQIYKTTGWEFTFTRMVTGMQALCDSTGSFLSPDALPSYGSPWGEETLTIAVDKNGPCFIFWKGASEVSRTAAESVQLEPFENIQQRIADQLNYIYGTTDNGSGGFDIEITKIRLGISMIAVKDRTDIGEYLPTWYVSFQQKFRGDGEDLWSPEQIMFSAVDGSYIEPRITNDEIMGLPPAGADSGAPEQN